MRNKTTIYFDMDGVLARWNVTATTEETMLPGYFLERECEKVIRNLILYLKNAGKEVCILSSVWNERCAGEKSKWLDRMTGKDTKRIFVPYGSNKADYIKGTGNLLVDDYTENLLKWKNSGNIPVKFYNGINGRNGRYNGYYLTRDMSVFEMASVIEKAAS